MKPTRFFLFCLVCVLCGSPSSAADFNIYLPSRETNSLWIVAAKESTNDLSLSVSRKIDLGFPAATVVAHPEEPILYIVAGRGENGGKAPGALVHLNADSSYKRHDPISLEHGYSYLGLDRANRFLLGANYPGGWVDVYPLDEHGDPGARVSALDEGRDKAHCVLPSPDNRFVYIPYVSTSNALYQYRFNADTGALTPLDPLNANPPEGTGPRHIAYHPTLPIIYFSNEQHLGVSVYEMNSATGQLTLRQVCDAVAKADRPEKGVTASDIAITPDGKFLFTNLRGNPELPDAISRYRIKGDGTVEHLGLTPADSIPWGLTFSPDANYLLLTAFKGATLTAFKITKDGDLEKSATLPIDPKVSDLVTR